MLHDPPPEVPRHLRGKELIRPIEVRLFGCLGVSSTRSRTGGSRGTVRAEVNVKESDFATVLLPLLSYPNDFDTYLGGWSTSVDPDDYSIFHSSKCVTKENPDDNNFVCWSNPEADKLLEDGRTELDQAKRKDIYFQFQLIAHDDIPYYFLWADLRHAGLTKSVSSSSSGIDLGSVNYFWNQDSWVVAPQ